MVKMGSSSATQIRCAIYTRKSSEEGLDQNFNSLDAQREACEAYIASQAHEGWQLLPEHFDDGGFSGGNVQRPALSRLLEHISSNKIDVVLVYKLDRLSRSLADFVRLIERFDQQGVSFVSITQNFNTSTSMGRLTLNVLLSFAQFEREVTGERIRDKIAASKRRGMWMGGRVPLGYDLDDRELHVNEIEAKTVRHIFDRYMALGCVRKLKAELDAGGYRSKPRPEHHKIQGEQRFSRGNLYSLLKNPLYIGKIHHDGELYEANHAAIVDSGVWHAVQARVSKNRTQHRTGQNAKHPSLLAGRITDTSGNRLSPTYTQKKGKRYSYYVNQALLQFRDDDVDGVSRIPAKELDTAVEYLLLNLLRNPTTLIDNLSHFVSKAFQVNRLMSQAEALTMNWTGYNTCERATVLEALDAKVVVSDCNITVTLGARSLCDFLLKKIRSDKSSQRSEHDSDVIRLSAAVKLRRSGIGKKLIIGNNPSKLTNAHPRSVVALQRTVLQAMRWNEELTTGQVSSIEALVQRDGLNRRQVYRVRQLAFLAPDIIARIAEGDVPETLTLEKLKKGFPMEWQKQRVLFGLAPPF